MNECLKFDEHFQRSLDRRDPREDPFMTSHAMHCEACRQKWSIWREIDATVKAHPDGPCSNNPCSNKPYSNTRVQATESTDPPFMLLRSRWTAFALAGSLILFIAMLLRPDHRTDGNGSLAQTLSNDSTILRDDEIIALPLKTTFNDTELDPVLWWSDIRNRDWIADSMPTVQGMQEGVAPLGRSIRRAVTLLATAGGEQTS